MEIKLFAMLLTEFAVRLGECMSPAGRGCASAAAAVAEGLDAHVAVEAERNSTPVKRSLQSGSSSPTSAPPIVIGAVSTAAAAAAAAAVLPLGDSSSCPSCGIVLVSSSTAAASSLNGRLISTNSVEL
jgi:hypothetical protein